MNNHGITTAKVLKGLAIGIGVVFVVYLLVALQSKLLTFPSIIEYFIITTILISIIMALAVIIEILVDIRAYLTPETEETTEVEGIESDN